MPSPRLVISASVSTLRPQLAQNLVELLTQHHELRVGDGKLDVIELLLDLPERGKDLVDAGSVPFGFLVELLRRRRALAHHVLPRGSAIASPRQSDRRRACGRRARRSCWPSLIHEGLNDPLALDGISARDRRSGQYRARIRTPDNLRQRRGHSWSSVRVICCCLICARSRRCARSTRSACPATISGPPTRPPASTARIAMMTPASTSFFRLGKNPPMVGMRMAATATRSPSKTNSVP